MKTKLNNSVRKLKHSKKTSKRFNNKIKSAKKLVKMVPKKNLKKSKKQKKTKSVKKMVGGAAVSVNCEDKTEPVDGTKYKECKIRASVATSGAVKTPTQITDERDKVHQEANKTFSLLDDEKKKIETINLTITLFIKYINANNCQIKIRDADRIIYTDNDKKFFVFCLILTEIVNAITFISIDDNLFSILATSSANPSDSIFVNMNNVFTKSIARAINLIQANLDKTDPIDNIVLCKIEDDEHYLFRLIGFYCDLTVTTYNYEINTSSDPPNINVEYANLITNYSSRTIKL